MKPITVVITGAAGGLGQALCLQYGGAGANIIGLDIDQEALLQLQLLLNEREIPSKLIQCDIRSAKDCQEAVDMGRAGFGPIDVLINNAGITHIGLFQDNSADAIREVMEVNLFGAVNCTKAVLPDLLERKGSIICVSSVAGLAPLMGRTAYSASKYALHGFFESLRTELHGTGVHVMMICPSTIDTDMRSRAISGAVSDQGVGKMAPPEFIADSILNAHFHKKRRLIIGPQAKLSVWLNQWMPRLYDRLMIRKVSPQLQRLQQKNELLGIDQGMSEILPGL